MTMIEKMWAMAAKERAATREWLGCHSNTLKPEKKRDPKECRNPERLRQIIVMRDEGKTNAEIARQLGITEQAIRNWRRKYKLK